MEPLFSQYITCPGCGLQLIDKGLPPNDQYNAAGECRELYHELSYYTLSKGDTEFIHEVIVDIYGAQHGGTGTSTMTIVFALAGLYLYLEKGYSGKEARQAHVAMAQHKGYDWPYFAPPELKKWMTIADVLAATDKDTMIHQWAESTWQAWRPDHARVAAICRETVPGIG